MQNKKGIKKLITRAFSTLKDQLESSALVYLLSSAVVWVVEGHTPPALSVYEKIKITAKIIGKK